VRGTTVSTTASPWGLTAGALTEATPGSPRSVPASAAIFARSDVGDTSSSGPLAPAPKPRETRS
jgi:hypothetical protein